MAGLTFQYYESTANPHHLAPASVAEIGHAGQANHQYDLSDFWSAVDAETTPAVSYLKPSVYQNGHAQSSDPLDEQQFLVNTINRIQSSKDWKSTAIVIAYDDSDGWYDHQMSPIVNDSQSPQDALSGDGQCGTRPPLGGYQDRCGYGPRQPLMMISPYSKVNAVDHQITDQTSILAWSRTTGWEVSGSATARSTPSRAASTASSTFAIRTRSRCIWTRPPDDSGTADRLGTLLDRTI